MLLVALTGGIGAGKSTVAELLERRGAIVIDADRIAREITEPGTEAFERIVERFGPGVVAPDGRLDRAALAARAFATPESRRALEEITHPAIGAEVLRRTAGAPPDAVVVHDIPLLAESGRAEERGYAAVVVVEAPVELRLDRLAARGVSRADAEARMAHQTDDETRRRIATHVITNDGDLRHLEAQVEALWAELLERRGATPDPDGAPPGGQDDGR